MKIVRKIELLAPAKNLECGIEAINHGADAVYIGAPLFSARSAAGNSIEDIRQLVTHAHTYFARVYVALNTIINDQELPLVEKMIREIYLAGADAIIIQDMGILQLDLPPIPIHASTQCNNRSLEKVRFLQEAGFSQVVLARELSLEQIKEIASHVSIPLEVFVHGALCVSYSGQCYISQALSGRSSNRGECAQYCRMPYTLQDAGGNTLYTNKHLLSIKDLNQSKNLENLLDAGVSSLKIEGRLKDLSYVKNITAFYRQLLDEIFLKRPEFVAASSGKTIPLFIPNPEKSFNRGFTDFFLKGRNTELSSFDSPKSSGEPIGNVNDLGGNSFSYSGSKQINNGDGLCFLNEKKEMEGFRVNRAEGRQVFPAEMPRLNRGIFLYRNYDHEFEKTLSKKSAERKINLKLELSDNRCGFSLKATDEDGCSATVMHPCTKEHSNKDQEENSRAQLSKLGNTIFELRDLRICFSDNWFIPSSLLSDLKRKVVESLMSVRKINYTQSRTKIQTTSHPYPEPILSYLGNCYNKKAVDFYHQHGVKQIEPAFESLPPKNPPLMFIKHCLLYQLGHCRKTTGSLLGRQEALTLFSGNHRLKLHIDCENCQMLITSAFPNA